MTVHIHLSPLFKHEGGFPCPVQLGRIWTDVQAVSQGDEHHLTLSAHPQQHLSYTSYQEPVHLRWYSCMMVVPPSA